MKEILRNLDTWGPRGPQGYVLLYIFLTIKAAAPSFHVFVRNIVGVGVENKILKKVQNFKFYNEIIRGVHADPKMCFGLIIQQNLSRSNFCELKIFFSTDSCSTRSRHYYLL